jgi:hypothetical protein
MHLHVMLAWIWIDGDVSLVTGSGGFLFERWPRPPPDTPRWITRVSASFKTGFDKPSNDVFFIFLGSIALSTALIWLAGPSIVILFWLMASFCIFEADGHE